jgi:hypothetical protein
VLWLVRLALGYFLSSQTLLELKYSSVNNHRINNPIIAIGYLVMLQLKTKQRRRLSMSKTFSIFLKHKQFSKSVFIYQTINHQTSSQKIINTLMTDLQRKLVILKDDTILSSIDHIRLMNYS